MTTNNNTSREDKHLETFVGAMNSVLGKQFYGDPNKPLPPPQPPIDPGTLRSYTWDDLPFLARFALILFLSAAAIAALYTLMVAFVIM